MPPSPIDRNTPRSTTARSHDKPGYKPKTTAHQAVEAMKAPWRFEKALAGIKTGRHFEPLAWDKFNTALWGKPLASVLNAMDIPTSRAFVAAASGIATGMPSAIAAGLVTMNANLPLLETMFDHDGPQADAPLFERLAVMGLRFATDPQWAISKLGWGLAYRANSEVTLTELHRIITHPDTEFVDLDSVKKAEVRARAIRAYAEVYLKIPNANPTGMEKEIADAIIATALAEGGHPGEQRAALLVLPELGQPDARAISKMVERALRTPMDSDLFMTQYEVLKSFADMGTPGRSHTLEAIKVMLMAKVNPEGELYKNYYNAITLAVALGDRGVDVIVKSRPFMGWAGDPITRDEVSRLVTEPDAVSKVWERISRVEDLRFEGAKLVHQSDVTGLLNFGEAAIPEIWRRMAGFERARFQVIHAASEMQLVELLGFSREGHHNDNARVQMAKTLKLRLFGQIHSNPELSAAIAHAMAVFVNDDVVEVRRIAQSCVRAFYREPALEEKLADWLIQDVLSEDADVQAMGKAGLRTIGVTALHYVTQARWQKYSGHIQAERLIEMRDELWENPEIRAAYPNGNFTHAFGRPVEAMGLEGTDSLEELARNGMRPWEMVRELATRGAVGAMALARLAKTTTGDVLKMVREAEQITAGRAVRSWPSQTDGQWRDGPMRYLGEVLDEFRVRALLADMKSAPEVIDPQLRTVIDRVDHLLGVARFPVDLEKKGLVGPQYRLDAIAELLKIGPSWGNQWAPWHDKVITGLRAVGSNDINQQVREEAIQVAWELGGPVEAPELGAAPVFTTSDPVVAPAPTSEAPVELAEIAAADLQLTLSQLLPRTKLVIEPWVVNNPVALVAALHAIRDSAKDLHTVDGQSTQNGGPSFLRPVMDQLFKFVDESEFMPVRAAALRTAAYFDRDAAMPLIGDILLVDGNPSELRFAAIAALGDQRREFTEEATGIEGHVIKQLMARLEQYRGRGENPTELAAVLRILPNLGKAGVAAIPSVVNLVVEISINDGDEHIYKAAGEVVAHYAQRPETKEQPELRDLLNGEHPSLASRVDTADLVLSRVVKCVGPAMYPIALRRMVDEPTPWRDAFADVLSDALPTDLVELMPTATPDERLVIAEIVENTLMKKYPDGVHHGEPEHVAKGMIDYVVDPNPKIQKIARGILETHSTDVLARIWMDDLYTSTAHDSRVDFQMPGDPPLPELDREGLQRRALAGLRYMGEEALPQLMETLRDIHGDRSYPAEYGDTLRTLAEEITASALQRMQVQLTRMDLTNRHRSLLGILPETVLRDLIRRHPSESHLVKAVFDVLARDVRGSTTLTEIWMDTSLASETRGMAREALAKMSVAASLAFTRSPGGLGPREDQRRGSLSQDGMKMSEAGPRNFLEALRPRGR